MTTRVLYIQFTAPGYYPPLQHSSSILADQGCEIRFVGLGDENGQSLLSFPPHENRDEILLPKLNSAPLTYARFTATCFAQALKFRPDVVYASAHTAAPVALAIQKLTRIPVIYHEHDAPTPGHTKFQELCYRSRNLLANSCWRTVFPNLGRRDVAELQREALKRSLIVMNCPSLDDLRDNTISTDKSFTLYYHGSIVPIRVPMELIDALARLPNEIILKFAGYETSDSTGYIGQLIARAESLGIKHRIKYLGILQRNDAMLACSEATLGISFMPTSTTDPNEIAMAGASNKAFDYLACGKPFLVNDLDDWHSVFGKFVANLSCDPRSVESLEKTILWAFQNGDKLRELGAQGRAMAKSEWNYEFQSKQLITEILSL